MYYGKTANRCNRKRRWIHKVPRWHAYPVGGAYYTEDASVDMRITFPHSFIDLDYSLSYCKFWFEHDYYLTFFSEAIDGIKVKPMKININGSYNMDKGAKISGRWLAVGRWK